MTLLSPKTVNFPNKIDLAHRLIGHYCVYSIDWGWLRMEIRFHITGTPLIPKTRFPHWNWPRHDETWYIYDSRSIQWTWYVYKINDTWLELIHKTFLKWCSIDDTCLTWYLAYNLMNQTLIHGKWDVVTEWNGNPWWDACIWFQHEIILILVIDVGHVHKCTYYTILPWRSCLSCVFNIEIKKLHDR